MALNTAVRHIPIHLNMACCAGQRYNVAAVRVVSYTDMRHVHPISYMLQTDLQIEKIHEHSCVKTVVLATRNKDFYQTILAPQYLTRPTFLYTILNLYQRREGQRNKLDFRV